MEVNRKLIREKKKIKPRNFHKWIPHLTTYMFWHMIFYRIHTVGRLIHSAQRLKLHFHIIGRHSTGVNWSYRIKSTIYTYYTWYSQSRQKPAYSSNSPAISLWVGLWCCKSIEWHCTGVAVGPGGWASGIISTSVDLSVSRFCLCCVRCWWALGSSKTGCETKQKKLSESPLIKIVPEMQLLV